MRAAVVALVAGVVAAPVAVAQQFQPPPLLAPPESGSIQAAPWFSAPEKPLGDLFGRQKEKGEREQEKQRISTVVTTVLTPRPTVVCGMVVIPADPAIDPAIRRTPPANGPTFTMKTIVPKDCQLEPGARK